MPRNFNVLRDEKVRAKLIALIAEGIGVTYAAKQVGSDRRMVFKYREEDTVFDEAYREAYIFSVESAIGEAKMALENADSRDQILKFKELLKHAEWEAEKLLKHYQPVQKMEVEHQGPMVIGWEQVCSKCGGSMVDVTPDPKLIEGDGDAGLQKGISGLPRQTGAEEASSRSQLSQTADDQIRQSAEG